MEIANCMVAIAGDHGHTVPKYDVTPSEVAVLRAIHGEDAVFDLRPLGEADRTGKAEIDRLRFEYRTATDGDDNRIVDQLFPGAGARAIATFADLELPENLYAATGRVSAAVAAPKKGQKAAARPAAEPADGIRDMNVME